MDRNEARAGDGASTLDLSGRCIGSSYLLLRPLGQGATGTVWRGVDRSSGEPVAVKLLHDSLVRQPKLVSRFVQERTILLMLRHRNVVRVRDLFSVGESLGLVMDLVAGGNLRQHLRSHGPLPPAVAARVGAQIAAALAEAHGLGIVHRDLKPDNVLLADGVRDVRLTDFGIARLLNTPGLTTTNAVIGTPHYMSPEAFHGAPADPAADIYSLGVLLYELVSGCPPYDADSVAGLMDLHVQGDPDRREGIPDPFWAVIGSCLAGPARRPGAADLILALEDVAKAAKDVPALPPAEPRVQVERSPHPSLAGMPQLPAPRRRNQPASWRWARPWGLAAVVSGAMLASGVATTAWHFTHDTTTTLSEAVAQPPLVASVAPSPAASVPATRQASRIKTRDQVAVTATRTTATVRPKPAPTRTTRSPITEHAAGPLNCDQRYSLRRDNPVVVKPCHQVGEHVEIRAGLISPREGTASVSVALRNLESGTTTGAKTCDGLEYGNHSYTHECGPVTVPAERGHRYQVVMTWRFAGRGPASTGAVAGDEFRF
ncbi:serine/threonine-protein kinase [Actinoplanes sp. N902-109]|uniref:serine/threonine-protein kinase n=1 Tax=Actinoplanes sp. (strain N902-109) TaxID=649831 RepID=UPI0007C57ED6|nr:serine/threonine-protein kinase [Actinoplanes sp. N902-109]